MLIIILGYMGSGKTLLATDFCLDSKKPVLSNYKIDSDNVHDLEISQLFKLPYEKCLVVLDEAYAYIESRVSMSKLNLYMSYILFQSRKRGIDIICTAQLSSSLDNRFIELADLLIVAQQTKTGFRYFVTNKNKIRVFNMSFEYAEKIWGKYDTSQVVMPNNMQDLQTQIEVLDRDKLKSKIDLLEKQYLKKYKSIKLSHGSVDNFLLDIGESDVYTSYLYARLKSKETITVKNK